MKDGSLAAPTVREAAADILEKIETRRSYSNLELAHALKSRVWKRADANLLTELVYGSVQRLNTLDWLISRFVARPHRLDGWVRQLLRISFYQLRYLDRIPARAVVHEAVEIAKKRGHKGIAGFVNGVLRNALRHPEKMELPDGMPVVQRWALEHSHPEWLIEKWLAVFGEKETAEMLAANNVPPRLTVRVNALKRSRGELLEEMRQQGVQAEPSVIAAEGIVVGGSGNVAESEWFRRGEITVQDESSMLVARALAPEPGMDVLDACAAPGGKTTHLAELMQNRGTITAVDIHEHKRRLIEENVQRLGITIVKTVTADVTELARTFAPASFDRILLDAPCSGFGVIRRKPDIKWQKKPEDVTRIADVQRRILQSLVPLLKPGGVLVYSTCTVDPKENREQIERFCRENPAFQPDENFARYLPPPVAERQAENVQRGFVQILPHHFGSDGFFISRLIYRP